MPVKASRSCCLLTRIRVLRTSVRLTEGKIIVFTGMPVISAYSMSGLSPGLTQLWLKSVPEVFLPGPQSGRSRLLDKTVFSGSLQ